VLSRVFTTTVLAAFALAGGGCAYSVAAIPPSAPSLATTQRTGTTPRASSHAYVSDDSNPGHVYVYALPLTSGSRPLWDIQTNGPGSTGFAGSQTFILVGGPSGETGQGIIAYKPGKRGPTSFLLPTALLPEMLEVDSAGDVFQGQTYTSGSYSTFQINVFKEPITKNSAPAFTMNTAVNHVGSQSTRGMAFDRHGDLWVKDDDNQTMDEYEPPFNANSTPALTFPKGSGAPFGSMIFDAQNIMYATDGHGVDVYNPPFTKNTKRAFTIPVPSTTISLGIDASGDLYATTGDENVCVFVPPFSASSTPRVTMRVPGNPTFPFITIKQ
jgi:hypothetical protein